MNRAHLRHGGANPARSGGAPPRPRRRLGQNFLVDTSAVRRIVDLTLGSAGPLLEIGPGRGALTGELVRAAGRIAAVELDRDLAAWLSERFGAAQLVLYVGNALDLDLGAVAKDLGHPEETPLRIVGNLPYSISKPMAMRLVERRARIAHAVLMFQLEVAQRLTSNPGSRAYGPLSVLVGLTFRVRRLFDLGPASFRPRPEVRSTVTVWTPLEPPRCTDELLVPLKDCLRAAFAHRRRTLLNNLRVALPGGEPEARHVLALSGISPDDRAEDIPPEGFLTLAKAWPLPGGGRAL